MSASVSRLSRLAAIGGVTALAVLAVAGPAAAHVTANPSTAVQGSYTKVSFRVPNEMDNANTTQLEINLPLDHPIASVSVRPSPGWIVTVSESKLPTPIKNDDGEVTKAVSKIVWSKGAIAPGQFQEFDVSMGPLPTDTDTLAFKAVQIYSGGQVVRWDQAPLPGGKEPEHPAPTLHLTKAAEPTGAKGGGAAVPIIATKPVAGTSDDGTARLIGGLGLAAGLVGIGVAALALARARGRS
jgi:uncharacterized protein YcnI